MIRPSRLLLWCASVVGAAGLLVFEVAALLDIWGPTDKNSLAAKGFFTLVLAAPLVLVLLFAASAAEGEKKGP